MTHAKRDDYHIDPKIRADNYDVMLHRVEEQTAKGISFVYKRICQFSSSNSTFKDIDDPLFLEHCREMLTYKQNKGLRVYLKRASIICSTTFYIVDKKYLVLNVINTRIVNGHLQHYLKGEMIIHDPQQQLATIFLNMWEEIDNDASCVSVHTADLDETSPRVA